MYIERLKREITWIHHHDNTEKHLKMEEVDLLKIENILLIIHKNENI